MEEIAVEFVYSRQQEMKTFHLKGDIVKKWVEVIIVTFLHVVVTVDVLMPNSHDVILPNSIYEHFEGL